ncbi:hypothetical protein AB685_15775 [Bacillus sp. LL01]|uniref:DUF4097 family beta strand repeat-containing protein n=1 Tax=Bacillus sp. LL01 TaxID=1665556 RepID=UPI00064CDCEF|nr:DUF4097 family beta strand repeat-containing protein [Bacillus sp. LL01]KMJ57472.1 hypothetical protein AB685_15775 [Bacillus sp. LL01]
MRKILSFLFVLILIAIGATVVTGQFKETFSFNFNTTPIELEKRVSSNGVDGLEIDVTSADIKVVPVDRDDIYVKLSGDVSEKNKDKYKLKVNESSGKVQIEVVQPKFQVQMGVNITDLKLEVEVPKKSYTNLSTYSTSGDIEITGLEVDNIRTELTSGDVLVDGVKLSGDYSFKLTSGDVRIENTEARAIVIDGTSGDITFKEVLGDVQVDTTSGDITIWNVYGHIYVETTSGDISIENEKIAGNMEVEVTSGDVKIEFDETPTSLKVDYKGQSGKGTVNLEDIQYTEKSDKEIVGKIGDGEYLLKVRTTSGDFRLRN